MAHGQYHRLPEPPAIADGEVVVFPGGKFSECVGYVMRAAVHFAREYDMSLDDFAKIAGLVAKDEVAARLASKGKVTN